MRNQSRRSSLRSLFHACQVPPMGVRSYCERILRYSRCSEEAFLYGILLVMKFVEATSHPITPYNVHRLLITGTLVGAKLRDDEYYSNLYYSRIGGISCGELNMLELMFLDALQWDTWIDEKYFDQFLISISAPNNLQVPAAFRSAFVGKEVVTQLHEHDRERTSTVDRVCSDRLVEMA